jgi:hypothetical protein
LPVIHRHGEHGTARGGFDMNTDVLEHLRTMFGANLNTIPDNNELNRARRTSILRDMMILEAVVETLGGETTHEEEKPA